MRGIKTLSTFLFSSLIATTVISAQADVFSSWIAKRGGANVALEGFYGNGEDSLVGSIPFAKSSVINIFIGPNLSGDSNTHSFDPHSRWGYRAALGYDYPSCCCANYGFSLEYTYFRIRDRRIASVPAQSTSFRSIALVPFQNRTPFFNGIGGFNFARADMDICYDAIDLLAHQNRVMINRVDTQFFFGARYLKYRTTWEAAFNDTFVPGSVDTFRDEFHTHFNNRFNGAGPRIGIAGFYPLYKGFGLTTEVAGNLLFGWTRSFYRETLTSSSLTEGGFDEVGSYNNDPHARGKFVPGWSGKIAVAYHGVFCNCSSLNIEVGYRGDKYYEVSDVRAYVQGVSGTSAELKSGVYHDFDVSGPYISLAYHM